MLKAGQKTVPARVDVSGGTGRETKTLGHARLPCGNDARRDCVYDVLVSQERERSKAEREEQRRGEHSREHFERDGARLDAWNDPLDVHLKKMRT